MDSSLSTNYFLEVDGKGWIGLGGGGFFVLSEGDWREACLSGVIAFIHLGEDSISALA